jgi:stage IV sporulation protein FB
MIRFTIFGIPVEIQPFFWVTLIIFGGALDADTPTEMFQLMLFVLAGFISILVHELGHALTAKRYGAYSHIVLQGLGGFAAYSGKRLSRSQSFIVTAAGPGVQIALGVAGLYLSRNIPEMNSHGRYFLVMLSFISLFWAGLNLLPVLPLDGGQMLNALLGPSRIKITLWTTIIVAVVGGIAMLQFGSWIFPILLGMYAWQAFQALKENTWR